LTKLMWHIYYKKYTIKTLDFILSNGLIFRLYGLYYIDKISKLGRHAGLINWKGGSNIGLCYHHIAVFNIKWVYNVKNNTL
jgi:hypothetical protein